MLKLESSFFLPFFAKSVKKPATGCANRIFILRDEVVGVIRKCFFIWTLSSICAVWSGPLLDAKGKLINLIDFLHFLIREKLVWLPVCCLAHKAFQNKVFFNRKEFREQILPFGADSFSEGRKLWFRQLSLPRVYPFSFTNPWWLGCINGRPGVILELSEREKFCDIFRIFRERFWSKFWISLYILYIFTSPSAQDREVSQLKETFSPKSPSRMSPEDKGPDETVQRQFDLNLYISFFFLLKTIFTWQCWLLVSVC